MKTPLVVALFLACAVTANLVVAAWGQAALLFTAWILIPVDMLTRDVLHDRWRDGGIVRLMGALIVSGSALTYAVSPDAGRVAVASALAFAGAGAVDAVAYHALWHRGRWVRMNGSNALSSVTDSVIFPLVAFSEVSFLLCVGQAASKFLGGLVFSTAYLSAQRER